MFTHLSFPWRKCNFEFSWEFWEFAVHLIPFHDPDYPLHILNQWCPHCRSSPGPISAPSVCPLPCWSWSPAPWPRSPGGGDSGSQRGRLTQQLSRWHVYNSHLQQETRLESQYHVHVHHAQFGLDFRGFRTHCHIFVDIISPQAVTVPVLTSEDCSNQPGATPPSPDQVSRKTGNMYSQECVFSINIIF